MCATLLLSLSLMSYHFSSDEYNEQNPGIGITCNQFEVGFFENSISNESVYIGGRYGEKYGIRYGLVSGYQDNPVPYVVPFVRFGVFETIFIPPIEDVTPATLGLSLTVSFPPPN